MPCEKKNLSMLNSQGGMTGKGDQGAIQFFSIITDTECYTSTSYSDLLCKILLLKGREVMTTFIWIQKSYTHESWHFRHKMGKIHRSLSTSKHLRYSQIELSRNRYGKKSYEFPAEDAVTALASFDAPAFPEAPSEETPSSLEVTGANPPAVAPPPRWTKTCEVGEIFQSAYYERRSEVLRCVFASL